MKTSLEDATANSREVWQQIWSGLVAALFFARFFLPAESAAQGDTLWIVGLWLVCALAWVTAAWRGAAASLRFDWLDWTVAVWIGTQMVSAIVVISTTGDKRSAANLAWEWMGVGVVWVVMRHGVTALPARRALLRALIVTGIVLSGYGVYQHYVSHPQLAAEYAPLFDALRTSNGPDADAIRQKLAEAGIPTEGPALVLFEKRLRDSHEPLGLFALANTFGGFLAVCLLLALGEIQTCRRSGAGWRWLIPLFAGVALVGWCLLLTKSRTAWIGTLSGLLMLVIPRFRAYLNFRRFLVPAGLAFAAVVTVCILVFALGGLDRQVVSEAPKSLSYRIQYWQATWRLIADHVWLGVGPGNFRQHYLKYKLPEASEEIADPHNLFFEVAATGGIFSAVGLALFLGLVFAGAFQSHFGSTPTASPPTRTFNRYESTGKIVFWMAGLGAPLAFAGLLICWGEWDDRLLVLAVPWFAVAWVIGDRVSSAGNSRSVQPALESPVALGSSAAWAAMVALTVHFLGAGGIGMPAVSQLLVALAAISLTPIGGSTSSIPCRRRSAIFAGCGILILLAGLISTALLPVMNCRWWLRQGHLVGPSQDSASRESSLGNFRRAAVADPWSPEPWRNLFAGTTAGGIQSNDSFQAAVKSLHEIMTRDPRNYWASWTLGRLWLQKWRSTGAHEDARQAVKWLSVSNALYPTNSRVQAELAFALESANESSEAVAAAQRALAQDAIYHHEGHIDRYLDDSTRQHLEALVSLP